MANARFRGLNYIFLAVILILIVSVARAMFLGEACYSRYADSGLEKRYQFWSGCQLEINGKWIPASNYKEETE